MAQTEEISGSETSEAGANQGWEIKGYQPNDLTQIVELVNLLDTTYKLDWGTTMSEMEHELRGPRQDPPRQIVVARHPDVEGVAGYARLGFDNNEAESERIYYLNVAVHPQIAGQGLERELALRLLEIMRGYEESERMPEQKRATAKAFVHERLPHLRPMFEGFGLRLVRHYWIMVRPLDEAIDEPGPVEGVVLRPYRQGKDDEPSRRSFNNSFADHFDHHVANSEDWQHYITGESMRLDLSWLAEARELEACEPGTIVGFCICAVFAEENRRRGVKEGWIELLGTTRECRRKGLGRSLLLHGLHSLREAGLDTALLGVDSESLTGANRLYESVGFRTRSREAQLQCDLNDLKTG
jgi:mycothiol synthase